MEDVDSKFVVRDLKTDTSLGVFKTKNEANAFARTLQKDKVPKYRLVIDHERNNRRSRRYLRTKSEARKVFKEEFEIVANASSKSDLKALLEIDFVRRGPLYQAFQKDKLALDPGRNGWVIEKDGVFLPYDQKNFGKMRGFSTLQKTDETYIYSKDGSTIVPKSLFSGRVTSGQYTDFKSIDQYGNLLAWDGKGFVNRGPDPNNGTPNSMNFIDERGNRREVFTGQAGDFIPTLDNTLGGYYNRVPYQPDKKSEAEELSDAVIQARARIAQLEAERNSLNNSNVLDADAFIRNMGKTDVSDARLNRQKKAEEAQKKRIEAAKEKAKKDAKAQEAAKLAQVQAINDNLAKTVEDVSVNQSRFKLDSQYVKSYVEAGLGGTIDPDNIESWSYEYSPAGQKLILNYTEAHALSIGLPQGYNTQEFARARLIDLNVIPNQYGPSFSPIFKSRMGPTWNTNAVSPVGGRSPSVSPIASRGFPRRSPVYRRRIGTNSFIGAKKVLSKGNARYISHQARQSGLTARTIPAKGGYRVYLGPKRK